MDLLQLRGEFGCAKSPDVDPGNCGYGGASENNRDHQRLDTRQPASNEISDRKIRGDYREQLGAKAGPSLGKRN
jgi:hypothetical protein